MNLPDADSDRFERLLREALELPPPAGWTADLERLPARSRRRPQIFRFALAAAVVLALAAAFLFSRLDQGPQTIEEYVAQHFHHDGPLVLERGVGQIADNVEAMLAPFGFGMEPAAAGQVGFLMLCPTPDGIGVHFMVHTETGPVTIILMPRTSVDDGRRFDFDGMQAELVALPRGSAAIVARTDQDIGGMHEFVQASLRPVAIES